MYIINKYGDPQKIEENKQKMYYVTKHLILVLIQRKEESDILSIQVHVPEVSLTPVVQSAVNVFGADVQFKENTPPF